MDEFIGVKQIKAIPMKKKEYNKYRGWENPDEINLDDEGFLVEYPDGGQNHPDHDGYISWSPAEVFEKAYRSTKGMSFGLAIEAMKRGYKVARKGWKGKGIFVEVQEPDENSKMSHPYIYIDTTGLVTDNKHAPKNRVPWLASQTDMLSDDWEMVENE